MIEVYGIASCDTVRKARTWLDGHGLEHRFHDFRRQGVPAVLLAEAISALGWETIINRQGLTWRRLDTQAKEAVVDDASATALALEQPSVIKRPWVVWPDKQLTVGFKPEEWARHLPG